MKWLGAFLLLVSGYLLSRRMAEPGKIGRAHV